MATLRPGRAGLAITCPTCGQALFFETDLRAPDGQGHMIGEKYGACPKCRHVVGVAIAAVKAGRLRDDDVFEPEGWSEKATYAGDGHAAFQA